MMEAMKPIMQYGGCTPEPGAMQFLIDRWVPWRQRFIPIPALVWVYPRHDSSLDQSPEHLLNAPHCTDAYRLTAQTVEALSRVAGFPPPPNSQGICRCFGMLIE